MADTDQKRAKTGGRKAGTPNKSTAELKGFLDRVFARAFAEKHRLVRRDRAGNIIEDREVSFEDTLVEQLVTQSIDSRTFEMLVAYWAGGKPKAIEHKHTGKLTLEQIISGTVDANEDGDEEL